MVPSYYDDPDSVTRRLDDGFVRFLKYLLTGRLLAESAEAVARLLIQKADTDAIKDLDQDQEYLLENVIVGEHYILEPCTKCGASFSWSDMSDVIIDDDNPYHGNCHEALATAPILSEPATQPA